MKTIVRFLVTAVAVGLTAWLLPGIHVTGSSLANKALTLAGVALVFALVNAIIKPIVSFVTGCLLILTFGLFALVINAGMLLLTSWICDGIGVGFHVDGFWWALGGSIIISIVTTLLNAVLGTNRRESDSAQ